MGASVTAGCALTLAHDRKVKAVAEACCQEGIAFILLSAESLGGWHKVAEIEVRKLSAALARQQGAEEKEAPLHLFQKLSILLQHGNATLFLSHTSDNM